MRRSKMFFAIMGIVVFLTWDVRAEWIEFEFRGEVTLVLPDPFWDPRDTPPPWNEVKVGDPWSVKYIFDSAWLPYYVHPIGTAWYEPVKAFSFTMGAADLEVGFPFPEQSTIAVYDNSSCYGDAYIVSLYSGNEPYTSIDLWFEGPNTILNSVALPLCGDIKLSSFEESSFCANQLWGSFGGSVTYHACTVIPGEKSITTDTTWRGIGPVGNQEGTSITNVGLDWEAANAGWNTSLTFDDSDAAGWKSCINNRELPYYIWVDGPFIYGSTPSYYRKVFELSGTPTSGTLCFNFDDDAIIYINGQLAVSDTDGYYTDMTGIDVTSLLVPGTNLIAVKAHDSWGYQESFRVILDIDVPWAVLAERKQYKPVVNPPKKPVVEPPKPVVEPPKPVVKPPVYETSIVAVLANPSSFSRDIQLDVEFFLLEEYPAPPRGQYEWSIVSGADKVKFLGFPGDQTLGPQITVHPIGASSSRNDVKIKVKFTSWTAGVPSCEAYCYMTVAKPTSLRVVDGYPIGPEIYDDAGGVIGYVVDYAFQVYDQFAWPIPVGGMQVEEWMNLLCQSHRISSLLPSSFERYWTNENGIWKEQLGMPRGIPNHVLYKPIPQDFLMKVNQSIYVEGWLVSTRCQTYHYDYATSGEGVCMGGCY